MLLFRGLTLQVLDNISLSPFPAEYQRVASGFLNGLLGGQGYDAFTLLIGAIAVAGYAVSGFRTRHGAHRATSSRSSRSRCSSRASCWSARSSCTSPGSSRTPAACRSC